MASKLPPHENISFVKCAIFISLCPELKREILCVPGSEYDVSKSRYKYYRKVHWNAIVERKAKEIIKQMGLSENSGQKVLNILLAIALRMLIWAEYHEGTLDLTRYYSFNFLSFSHFTTQGVIDNKKAAEDMIKDANLDIIQKYKLACIYCFTHHISDFFKQIGGYKEDVVFRAGDSKWFEKPEIVKCWTFQLTGVVDIYNNTPRDYYRLQAAIRSGSIEAVKYSWEKAGTLPSEWDHVYTAIEMLNSKPEKSDWIVFRNRRFDDSRKSWIPNYFSVEILCFFLSNMTDSQQQKALEKNITSYETDANETVHMIVLEFFLFWPYQNYFMKTAALLWNLMPQETYAVILLKICDKIDPYKRKNLLYGEEKSYDYKKLLKDFWSQSPDHFKRYVFENNPIVYVNCVKVVTTTGIGLLHKLLSLKNFTYEEEEIIWFILSSATSEEKENLTSTEWWSSTCIRMLKKEKFEIFDRLLLVFCKSEEKIIEFQKKLNLYKEAPHICLYLLEYGKLHAVKSFINRISLSERQLRHLKEEVTFSRKAFQFCQNCLLSRRHKDFEEFVKWFPPCIETAILFKTLLISHLTNLPVHKVRSTHVNDFVTRFTRSKLPNRKVIGEIQTGVADIFGRAICEDLITGSSFQISYNEDYSMNVETEFRGGQWKKVDEFLTACLCTKEKILEFKKTFYDLAGCNIHFNLIKANQWKEAKRFFDWLELSEKEIKTLKEKTFFDRNTCGQMLRQLVFEHDDEMNNLETIDLLLRWHLTEKEKVIKFREDFFYFHENYDEVGLKKLNSLIENYFDDLDQEETFRICGNAEERFFRYLDGGGGKRKSSVFPQQKKLRVAPTGEEMW